MSLWLILFSILHHYTGSALVCGIFAGLILANETRTVSGYYSSHTETVFNWVTAIAYWFASLVSSSLFFGFATVINLLQALVDRNSYTVDVPEASSSAGAPSYSAPYTPADDAPVRLPEL